MANATPIISLAINTMAKQDIPRAIELFDRAYSGMSVPADERASFIAEIRQAFESENRDGMTFFKIEQNSRLISFAAIEPLGFATGAWALRWGTTDPQFQRKGHMGRLIDHRIKFAEHNSSSVGSIHIMARSPGIYLKRGFTPLYLRGPENAATYLMKVINQS